MSNLKKSVFVVLFLAVGFITGYGIHFTPMKGNKAEASVSTKAYQFSIADLPYLSDDEVVNIKNEYAVRLSRENKFDSVSYFRQKRKESQTKPARVYCLEKLESLTRE